jgi:hypothetical protein
MRSGRSRRASRRLPVAASHLAVVADEERDTQSFFQQL